ncbi:MAG: molybdenum cofactor guanylyltransferase [Cyanobacteria bacterium REEB65]|nr:molybdenum cofactor guanylyltransferase [Cyanobacteria bacterium REEB65]
MAAGAILAGGQSKRFGANKALVPWLGRPLLEHPIQALGGVKADPMVVVGGDPALVPRGLNHLSDRYAGQGPLGGILTALETLAADVLVLACDMPQVAAEALLPLMAHAGPELVAIPTWRGQIQPLCALYRQAALVPMSQRFAAGERSVVRVLLDLPVAVLYYADDVDWFENVNTPADLARLTAGEAAVGACGRQSR